MSASPKFRIFGAGAIGGLIATLLARSGATVSAVARAQTLAALNRDGVPDANCVPQKASEPESIEKSAATVRFFGSSQVKNYSKKPFRERLPRIPGY